ncbi:MAG: hypothetical protein JEZ12_27585 [Desulfobacterium sp.]|nr:hypothetical protein [Desulfobacterium sp.]
MRIPELNNRIEKIRAFLAQKRAEGAIVMQPSDLTPVSYYRPVVELVNLSGDDIYYAQKKFRVAFSGLTKLGNAAGVEWDPTNTCRTDNRSDKLYVSFRAVGGIRKNDGRLYPVKAEYDLDLEIIEEEIRETYYSDKKRNDKFNKGKSDEEFAKYAEFCIRRDFIQKRKRKLPLAESGAKARVLRALLGVKSQFSQTELNITADDWGNVSAVAMPFFVVRFILDHQNPDIKSLFLKVAERNMCGLYGEDSPMALPSHVDVSDAIEIGGTDHAESEPEATEELPTDREQFLSYDAQTQGDILSQLSQQKKFDIESVLKHAQVTSPEQLPTERRINFYDFLTEGQPA